MQGRAPDLRPGIGPAALPNLRQTSPEPAAAMHIITDPDAVATPHAQVAVLNETGAVLVASGPWETFLQAGSRLGAAAVVGTDYLAACERAERGGWTDGRMVSDGLRQLLAGEREAFAHEYLAHLASEECRIRLKATRFADGTGTRVLLVVETVTTHRRVEVKLRDEQRFAALGRMASGVVHDFNNVLTVIDSCTAVLLDDLPAGHPTLQYVRDIEAASRRAAALTRQFLARRRQQPPTLDVLDLNEVLREMAGMLRRLLPESVQLTFDGDGEPAQVRVDPCRIEQVVVNLVANARDAMPRGGELSIRVERMEQRASDMAGTIAVHDGTFVALVVRDTGCGMDEHTRDRIFEPFFTTKAVGRGTGVGLATVHDIVTQSGGHICVDSTLNHGTTFRVLLPLAPSVCAR